MLVDKAFNITRWSPGAEELYGFSEEEVLSDSLTRLYALKDRENMLTQLESLQSSKKSAHEAWHVKKDSSTFLSRVSFSTIYDEQGGVQGYLLLSKDLTAEHTLEKHNELFKFRLEEEVNQRTRQLQIANEELEAFSYSVSHDLRAPLRAINGFSQVLIEQYSNQLDEEGIRLLQVVHWNAGLMGQLIDDLLKFSRLSKLNVMETYVDMSALVDKALALLLTPMHRGLYELEIRPLHPCMGDENMLLQVWMNLIDNALKYSSKTPNPRIEIGSEEHASSITYYIKDNGAGFDMKYAHKLFGVFQRLHSHDKFSGTGLGLALIKRIISKHSGEIYGKGEVDKGAEFRFTLQKSS